MGKKVLVVLVLALVLFDMFSVSVLAATVPEVPSGYVRLHYYRPDHQYEGWGLHIWGAGYDGPVVEWSAAMPISGYDEYGAFWDIPYKEGVGDLNFIIHKGDLKDPQPDRAFPDPDNNKEFWAISGDVVAYTSLDQALAVIGRKFKKNTYRVGEYLRPVPRADEIVPVNYDIQQAPPLKEGYVRLHYRRPDGNYDGWGLHLWGEGYAGETVLWSKPVPFDGVDDYGAWWDIPYHQGVGDLNFIIHKGDLKDPQPDRAFPDPDNNKEFWAVSGEVKVYLSREEAIKAGGNKVVRATIVGPKEMIVEFRAPIENPIFIRDGFAYIPLAKLDLSKAPVYHLTLQKELNYSKTYKVECGSMEGYTTLAWQVIDQEFTYDGELGALYQKDRTTFRLWAPLASAVRLLLFAKWDDQEPYRVAEMALKEKGVWELTVEGDLRGQFYQYQVVRNGETKTVLDPYAKSMAAFTDDGKDPVGKGAIVDPSAIGPELSFAQIDGYEKREDAIIWEIHVRDFTSDPNLKTEAQFGTYKAFIEKLDYIKELGVTHIQLLPVLNYYYGNELKNGERELHYSAQGNNYNWGYDPHNYFTPEGMYSEDPTDPELRIKELKELIKAIHERGMGVILDVVYNHTAKMELFEDIVPGYYYFVDAQGKSKSSYGGGRLGTTHAMARKLVLDSIAYWVSEYKVDGFRFDLMGDLDAETVQMACDVAKALNPNILILGEGWITYEGDDGDHRVAADQKWMHMTDDAACFSDEIRNEVKSGFGCEGEPRFITGGKRNIMLLFSNIKGQPTNMTADDPGDVVQYIEAHDNLTLHDVIAYSIRKDPSVKKNEEEIHKRIRLGNTIILTSQGIAFLHAGQEYGRTKQWLAPGVPEDKYTEVPGFKYPYFIHDSYDSTDIINRFDWNKVTVDGVHRQTMEYTKGLIALRRSTDAFRLGSQDLVNSNVKLIRSRDIAAVDTVIAYSCQATNGDTYYVFINADTKRRNIRIDVDLRDGVVLVDSDEAGVTPVTKVSGVKITANAVTIDPLTAVIIKK
ncbi:pullulanase [Capillibacterium thermochitinicola]|uniref:pullulanase n=1 Tax=Capillibacterium thermochitinicola TaxID=2699427 RepID=A0A8J6I2V1_9FIRM|nr:pullulanase [Capillibacterium thermochitinicola]